MFGRRADGELVTGLSRTHQFMPFISPRRNDSNFLYSMNVEAGPALDFLERYNEGRPRDQWLSMFNLVLASLARCFNERPGVNRFVVGGRLYQRKGVWITYSAKQEMLDGAPILTVKNAFPEGEKLDEMVTRLRNALLARRRGKVTQSDKEVKLALQFPPLLVKVGVWALDRANRFGLLPKAMIDDDPMFASVFVADLGSVGLSVGFHHLWEYGTCSHFVVIGQLYERHDGVKVFDLGCNYDERVADGLYAAISLEGIKGYVEHPEFLMTGEKLAYRDR